MDLINHVDRQSVFQIFWLIEPFVKYGSETLPKLSNIGYTDIFCRSVDYNFTLSAYSTILGTLQFCYFLFGVSEGSRRT